mgnify:CR=1 FL=1
MTQNCCVLPVRDISDSFKVDVGDYGCLIYYYANFGGNLISSLAAYTERIHRQIEEYIYRDCNVKMKIKCQSLSGYPASPGGGGGGGEICKR